MENKELSVQDLIQDESFVKWVVSPDETLDRQWNKWGEANAEQSKAMDKARELVLSMSFDKAEKAPADEPLWDRIENTIGDRESQSAGFGWKPFLRVAAVLVVGVLFSLVYFNQSGEESVAEVVPRKTIVKENPNGAKSQVRLPDGTKVWLNSGSKLTYLSRFSDDSRNVELNGEAFFEVVENKSKPFVIQTPYFQTTVLGTSFSVKAYENAIPKVSLVEGKVKVSKLGIDQIIKPGEQVVLKGEQLVKQRFDYNKEIGWKEGLLYFEEDSPKVLFDKLEMWYGVTIDCDIAQMPSSKYSGQHQNQSLETVLKGISYSLNFDYELQDKQVKILFNPK